MSGRKPASAQAPGVRDSSERDRVRAAAGGGRRGPVGWAVALLGSALVWWVLLSADPFGGPGGGGLRGLAAVLSAGWGLTLLPVQSVRFRPRRRRARRRAPSTVPVADDRPAQQTVAERPPDAPNSADGRPGVPPAPTDDGDSAPVDGHDEDPAT